MNRKTRIYIFTFVAILFYGLHLLIQYTNINDVMLFLIIMITLGIPLSFQLKHLSVKQTVSVLISYILLITWLYFVLLFNNSYVLLIADKLLLVWGIMIAATVVLEILNLTKDSFLPKGILVVLLLIMISILSVEYISRFYLERIIVGSILYLYYLNHFLLGSYTSKSNTNIDRKFSYMKAFNIFFFFIIICLLGLELVFVFRFKRYIDGINLYQVYGSKGNDIAFSSPNYFLFVLGFAVQINIIDYCVKMINRKYKIKY